MNAVRNFSIDDVLRDGMCVTIRAIGSTGLSLRPVHRHRYFGAPVRMAARRKFRRQPRTAGVGRLATVAQRQRSLASSATLCFGFLHNRKSIVDFDTEIPHRAFELGVSEQ